MGLGQRLLGGTGGHAGDNSGGLIRRARLYEASAAVGFAGQRRRVYDELLALANIRAGDRVLDVGCGTGYFSRRAARVVGARGQIVGLDPSQPMLAYASRTSPPNCRYVLAGAQELPEPDASTDVVISSLAMHHVPPALRPVATREMARVLRPGGQVLIADFRAPRNPQLNHLIGALSGHAMSHNPIEQLAELLTGADLHITASGDRWPFLHYVRAEKPADTP